MSFKKVITYPESSSFPDGLAHLLRGVMQLSWEKLNILRGALTHLQDNDPEFRALMIPMLERSVAQVKGKRERDALRIFFFNNKGSYVQLVDTQRISFRKAEKRIDSAVQALITLLDRELDWVRFVERINSAMILVEYYLEPLKQKDRLQQKL